MFESDDYKWGERQASNGVHRDTWSGRMSRDEIRGYHDEMDRQARQQAESYACSSMHPTESGTGDDGSAFVLIAFAGCFAVFWLVALVMVYWQVILMTLGAAAALVAVVWRIRRIPLQRWQHWGGIARALCCAVVRRSLQRLAGLRTAWARLRRHALARLRGRHLPGPEVVVRRAR